MALNQVPRVHARKHAMPKVDGHSERGSSRLMIPEMGEDIFMGPMKSIHNMVRSMAMTFGKKAKKERETHLAHHPSSFLFSIYFWVLLSPE